MSTRALAPASTLRACRCRLARQTHLQALLQATLNEASSTGHAWTRVAVRALTPAARSPLRPFVIYITRGGGAATSEAEAADATWPSPILTWAGEEEAEGANDGDGDDGDDPDDGQTAHPRWDDDARVLHDGCGERLGSWDELWARVAASQRAFAAATAAAATETRAAKEPARRVAVVALDVKACRRVLFSHARRVRDGVFPCGPPV